MPTFYDILRVQIDASPDELRRAYRRRARECHPDREAGREADMVALNQAWETLKDPRTRARYDDTLGDFARIAGSSAPRRPPQDPQEFLLKVFRPADQEARRALADLLRALDEVAYDVYDDCYVTAFGQIVQEVERRLDQIQHHLRMVSLPDAVRVALSMYLQGIRHVDQAVDEFEAFLESYDIDSLVVGKEFLLTGLEILASARDALGGL